MECARRSRWNMVQNFRQIIPPGELSCVSIFCRQGQDGIDRLNGAIQELDCHRVIFISLAGR
jgi:hypothetical protein